MAIDLLRGGRTANRGFKATKTTNSYLKTLIKVHLKLFSFILSWIEELSLNSIKLSIKDLTNQDSIDILSHCQESLELYLRINKSQLKENQNSIIVSLLLLEALLMITDLSIFLKD